MDAQAGAALLRCFDAPGYIGALLAAGAEEASGRGGSSRAEVKSEARHKAHREHTRLLMHKAGKVGWQQACVAAFDGSVFCL